MRTLLLYGDSNTHGTMPMPMQGLGASGRFPRADRWPGRLAQLLPGWEVIAEGHPGRTTLHDDPVEGAHRNGLTVLPAILESHRPVDVVLLMLGTNDLKARFSVTASDIALSLERLVRVIRASESGPGRGASAELAGRRPRRRTAPGRPRRRALRPDAAPPSGDDAAVPTSGARAEARARVLAAPR